MTTESLSYPNPEDIFAKAIERVEAGETVEAVLDTAPEPLRAELREVLLLISATHHLQRAPVPQPAAPRRAERKRAFLEAAATMKAASTLSSTPVVAPLPKPRPVQVKAPWWTELANFWRDLQVSFTAPNLRLAPLLTIIAVVYLGAFGFVRAARATAIGEPAYVVKQWMRVQKFNLSSTAQRPYVYQENVEGIIADIANSAANLQVNQPAGEQAAPAEPLRSTESLVFDGFVSDYLISGNLRILMRYQPDLTKDEYTATFIPVPPGEGQFVDITFQIVPDQAAGNGSTILQAISVIVPDTQPEMDPTPTPAATATPLPTATPCQPYLPAGWIRYSVPAGDTLSAIAARTGTTVAELQRVNCIFNANVLAENAIISAPNMPPTSVPTVGVPTLAATLTAISTTVLTPSIGITPTMTAIPTATATVAVTPALTATVAPTGTTVITDPANQTPTAVQTPTPPPTVTLTVTGEPTTEGTATPVAPPVTATAPPEGTLAATATPTGAAAEATPTALVTPTPIVADTPTPEPMLTATSADSGGRDNNPPATPPPATTVPDQGGGGGGGAEPPPTDTPIPQSRSPLTGG